MRLLLRGLECGEEISKAGYACCMRMWFNFMRLIMHYARLCKALFAWAESQKFAWKKTGLVTIAWGIIQFVLVKGRSCIDSKMPFPRSRQDEEASDKEKRGTNLQ